MKELHQRDLKETVGLMQSTFYKSRFVAEYLQVAIRYAKLNKMVEAWDKGELNFTPTCPREIYDRQLSCMGEYLSILEERAKMEKVNLTAFEEGMTFSEALAKLFQGEKIALADWAGYWYLHEDGQIHIHTKEGYDLITPDFVKYSPRNDWRIYDEVNEANLREYEERLIPTAGHS